jgi:hypothetical protein
MPPEIKTSEGTKRVHPTENPGELPDPPEDLVSDEHSSGAPVGLGIGLYVVIVAVVLLVAAVTLLIF